MKNLNKILTILVFAVLTIISCGKNEESIEVNQTEVNYFRIQSISPDGDSTHSIIQKIEVK